MGTRCFLPTTFACCFVLSLALTHADISWFHDDIAEETENSRPKKTTLSPRAARQPDIHQLSEAFGHFIGQDISKQGIHLDINDVINGIRNGVEGKPAPLSEKEYDTIVSNFRSKHFQELANFNLALADAFMTSNGKRADIVQVAPGKVQYVVLQRGQGPKVDPHSTPVLRFTGRFIDGTLFSQTENNQAIPVPLDDMVPGFRQGVIGMQEGEKRRIFIHPDVAYGTTGNIAPNSLLLFEVETVKTANRPNQRLGTLNSKQQPLSVQQQPQEDDWDLTLDEEDDDADLIPHPVQHQHRFVQPVVAIADEYPGYEDDEGDSLDDWDELEPQISQNLPSPSVKPKQPQSRYYFHPHR